MITKLDKHSLWFRNFTISATFIAWFGILLQFVLSLQLSIISGKGYIEGIVIYFGFFTVLTNIFVALVLSAPLFFKKNILGRFFCRPGVASTAAAAITIVGLAYFLLLRNVWNPQGWQFVADIILHYVTPVLFLIYWWFEIPKIKPSWSDLLFWILYPLGYGIYIFIRGELTGLYPYYFMDASVLGYLSAIANVVCIGLGFVIVAALLIAIAQLKNKSKEVA